MLCFSYIPERIFSFLFLQVPYWYMKGNDWGSFIYDSPEPITCSHKNKKNPVKYWIKSSIFFHRNKMWATWLLHSEPFLPVFSSFSGLSHWDQRQYKIVLVYVLCHGFSMVPIIFHLITSAAFNDWKNITDFHKHGGARVKKKWMVDLT